MHTTIKLTDIIKQHIFEHVKDQIAKAKGTEATVSLAFYGKVFPLVTI